MYTYNRVTSICIDLPKIKVFVYSYSDLLQLSATLGKKLVYAHFIMFCLFTSIGKCDQ